MRAALLKTTFTFMKNLLLIALCFAFAKANSQQPSSQPGNVIKDFGKTFAVPEPDFKTDTEAQFYIVFDVAKAPEDPSVRNPYIETMARFLNMHDKAGVPKENMHIRAAIHGKAAYGVLTNELYKEKYGVDNPNIALLEALSDAGVELILCGQTAGSRNITSARRLEMIDVALSAMTVLSQSQMSGYSLIAF